MTNFLPLWRRELAAYFLSPVAYVVTIFFLVVMGFSFWLLASILIQGEGGITVMKELFGSVFFWLALLVIVPLLTMRLLAEEKRSGTMEALMTAPVTDAEMVLAKYAGALSFFVAMWIPTVTYAFILREFSSESAPIDLGPMMGGYFGALLIGAFYLSVGVFCSSLTRNQTVSAMMCFAVLGVAFFVGFLPYISRNPVIQVLGLYVSSVTHMLDMSRGAVDTRPIVLYVTGTFFMLFATVKTVESQKWR
jgi:ABC-2 type transport system permease protein